jgi:hypothetical protein
MTIRADNNSTVTVYDDIYGYDEAQWTLLKKKGIRVLSEQ